MLSLLLLRAFFCNGPTGGQETKGGGALAGEGRQAAGCGGGGVPHVHMCFWHLEKKEVVGVTGVRRPVMPFVPAPITAVVRRLLQSTARKFPRCHMSLNVVRPPHPKPATALHGARSPGKISSCHFTCILVVFTLVYLLVERSSALFL